MNEESTIIRLKEKKNAIIIAHNYQRPEIQDIADFIGDSLGLSRKASETDAEIIIFCGVKFMAETAKILSPDKTVLLPRKDAGCPMADMIAGREVRKLRAKYPEAAVVSYVNTNADVKAESDVCCTSSNAVEVARNIDRERIIFIPDKNLASYVQRFVDKEIIPWDGYCYVHNRITEEEVQKARENHHDALLLVHPECKPSIINLADEVLSTGGIVRASRERNAEEFLIGTEEGLLYRLKKENPCKKFYTAGAPKICRNMKKTTLNDVRYALKEEGYPIELPEDIIEESKNALKAMLRYA